MGLSDWYFSRAETMGSRHTPPSTSVDAKKQHTVAKTVATAWTIVEGLTRSKSERKKQLLRLQSCTPVTKDFLHHTVVTKFYPAIIQLCAQGALSPPQATTTTCKPDTDFSSFFAPPQAQPTQSESESAEVPKVEIWIDSEPSLRLAKDVETLLASGSSQFQITSEGCGGVYFLQDRDARLKEPLGIFKPRDEEYMAPKNPRGYVKEGVVGLTEHPMNKGFRIGNGAIRERAAYLLDEAYGNFSGVPVTNMMTLNVHGEEKEGSMQRFVESECSAEDMGTLKFAIPEVHKIGILDVRLFNTDRHAGNILLSTRANEQTYGMTPIDHGFCLPSYKHLDGATFDWLQWPQAQFPFTCAELNHIESLDTDGDASTLRSLSMEEDCITTMRLSTALLQVGADAGFSLFEIGSCLQRDGDFMTPSTLEIMVGNAVEHVEKELGLSEARDGRAFYDALVEEVERASISMFNVKPRKKVRSISCFS